MDDIVDSISDKRKALSTTRDIEKLISKGGFKIKGCILSGEHVSKDGMLVPTGKNAATEKVLGVAWNPVEDKFCFALLLLFDAVSMWAKENKMKMHPAKTKYSIISTRQKIANSAKQSLDLSVDGMQLTKVESERVLGVYIDNHLTWNEHIDTLRRKLLQRIAILSRARKYIPAKYRLLLYNASIKPLFTYCCPVLSNCSQTNIDELFKLQKRCARLILDSPRDARSYDNFQKLK